MSGNSYGEQKPGPGPTAGVGSDSPELLSKAISAFNWGIASIAVGFCCCGPVGLVLGIITINNAGAVTTLAPPGSESYTKPSTAKTLAIVGIVLSLLNMLGWSGGIFMRGK